MPGATLRRQPFFLAGTRLLSQLGEMKASQSLSSPRQWRRRRPRRLQKSTARSARLIVARDSPKRTSLPRSLTIRYPVPRRSRRTSRGAFSALLASFAPIEDFPEMQKSSPFFFGSGRIIPGLGPRPGDHGNEVAGGLKTRTRRLT
jgi:hypothetical protein